MQSILFDSGPLAALFNRNDQFHQRAVEFLRSFTGEIVTNVAVLTETAYLLDFSVDAQLGFLEWLTRGAVTIVDLTMDDLVRVREIVEKYADLPADFTDASLVAIAERLGIQKVASVDSDFSIYRYRDRQHFQNVFLEP